MRAPIIRAGFRKYADNDCWGILWGISYYQIHGQFLKVKLLAAGALAPAGASSPAANSLKKKTYSKWGSSR